MAIICAAAPWPAQSQVMKAIKAHAEKGGAVLGICNGFQVLTEAGLLPGALMRNAGLKFVCKPVTLTVEETQSAFTRKYEKGQSVTFPVAHGEGNYYADGETLDRLEGEGRVMFRYQDNPNGSARNIAGILNRKAQCAGPDAPSRAGGGSRDRRHRRPRPVPEPDRSPVMTASSRLN